MSKFIIFSGHIKHFLRKNSKNHISAFAGQISFFIILSFVPFFMFVFALLSYFNVPVSVYSVFFVDALPDAVESYLKNIISEAYPQAVKMAFASAIIALWSAGRGIHCIRQAVFVIYKKPDRKNWIFKRFQATIYMLIMFVVLVLAVIVLVISQFFSKYIADLLKKLPYSLGVIYAFRYAIIFFVLTILIAIALKIILIGRVKNKKYIKLKCLLPGAFMTSLGWTVLSVGITVYIRWFGGYVIYGSLATATIIMVWLYFAMYIFLCSNQFNYIYRRKISNFRFRNLFKK